MLVEVRNNDVASALRKLKRKMYREGILQDYMDHVAYTKPSVRKRRKRAEAIRRAKRAIRLVQ